MFLPLLKMFFVFIATVVLFLSGVVVYVLLYNICIRLDDLKEVVINASNDVL